MLEVSQEDIRVRIQRDNPWWAAGSLYQSPLEKFSKRIYFEPFADLATDFAVRRAAVLMGPRRVGKTVMLRQLALKLLADGANPKNILYVSIDTPIYSQIPLEKFLDFLEEHPLENPSSEYFIMLDEIQYLKNWEVHLKDLVDVYQNVKFIASGSAAAALRLASQESGAGRFSDFQLPPLTFAEFIDFIGKTDELIFETDSRDWKYGTSDIESLNAEFINYLNYGGYPEAVLSERVRRDADQFVRNDIIDKVLLKDLPALYGIMQIQELNQLFAHLAYNTGEEVSLQKIAKNSGISKPTISRYIEYLESAFLIMKISRLDGNARRLTRETNFKVYLNNPSMRSALFAPVESSNTALVGHLAESAIFAQWQHGGNQTGLFYARWSKGEIDMVHWDGSQSRPEWAVEIKWSDRVLSDPHNELKGLANYIESSKITDAVFTTRTKSGWVDLHGKRVDYLPTSLYCYTVGRNVTSAALADLHS